ncbi:hypothetical protein [Pseudarthrobacter oxydans]|uniref:hypothetical protein n=1 Tax=Pseudarthrobacter oxydans TaxID=1671 RepID=UPI00341A279D
MTPGENQPLITDWLQGIGTAGALLVSVVLAFISIVLSYRDRKATRDAEAMERARVFAHVEVDATHLTWRVVNASPYPIRQINVTARPFYVGAEGKKIHPSFAHLTHRYLGPNDKHEESFIREKLPEDMRLHEHMENAVRLDFVDYQGTHWVRAASGHATPIEKLKGAGFDPLPRTVYEPGLSPDSKAPSWINRLSKSLRLRLRQDAKR